MNNHNNKQKIAFIYHPDGPNTVRLNTMPFAINSVIFLANSGWEIDLYLWEKPDVNYTEIFPDNVTINYINELPPSPLSRIRHLWLKFKFLGNKKYICVFGVGLVGVYIASLIAQHNNCYFIYLNDEFPSSRGNNIWSKLEKQVAQKATIIVLPDSQRIPRLLEELNLSSSTPSVGLPNIPIVKPIFSKINWYKRLGIPQDSIPFLHAGTFGDWAQLPEILSSVPYWPEKAVLILHSRSPGGVENYRRELSHLDIPGKVFWSCNSLSEDDLHSLVKFCFGNFALYRNVGPNLEYVGLSSGKLMRSLACGCPVISSNLPSLSFVKEYKLGVMVNHPVEIPKAVEEIAFNKASYENRCLQFCNDIASFEKAWEIFCQQFQQITQLNLMPSKIFTGDKYIIMNQPTKLQKLTRIKTPNFKLSPQLSPVEENEEIEELGSQSRG
jgi:glycosyltransferase involved in cell wall biosynthesis